MGRDKYPAAAQGIVSSVRYVVENFVGHVDLVFELEVAIALRISI